MSLINGMTENEAATRGCPMNHWEPCRASGCALWQWVERAARRFRICDDPLADVEPERPWDLLETWTWVAPDPDDHEPAGWLEPADEAVERYRGVCGLSQP